MTIKGTCVHGYSGRNQNLQQTKSSQHKVLKHCATGRVGGVSHLQGGLGLKGYILYPKKINLGQSG